MLRKAYSSLIPSPKSSDSICAQEMPSESTWLMAVASGVGTPYCLPSATTASVVGTPSATPLLTLVASSTLNPLPKLDPNV